MRICYHECFHITRDTSDSGGSNCRGRGVVVIGIVVSSGGIIAGRGRWVLRAGFLPTSCTRSDDEKKKDQFGRIQKGTEEDRSSVLHCISPIVCHLLFSSLSHFGLGRFAE